MQRVSGFPNRTFTAAGHLVAELDNSRELTGADIDAARRPR
jgi:hypothetical protein